MAAESAPGAGMHILDLADSKIQRKSDLDPRTLTKSAFNRELAAVALDDVLHDGEPETCTS